jgi:hypothetical protein
MGSGLWAADSGRIEEPFLSVRLRPGDLCARQARSRSTPRGAPVEMLAALWIAPGQKKNGSTLQPSGINKNQSRRWRTVASVAEPEFETHLWQTKDAKRELTSAGVIALSRALGCELRGRAGKKPGPYFLSDPVDACGGAAAGVVAVAPDVVAWPGVETVAPGDVDGWSGWRFAAPLKLLLKSVAGLEPSAPLGACRKTGLSLWGVLSVVIVFTLVEYAWIAAETPIADENKTPAAKAIIAPSSSFRNRGSEGGAPPFNIAST